ncbi:OLC1v1010018C1 [Oldenlandia corymbosa var. corymbosa]|uniref:OLC1v1010018C1 n=1 Tax=Oldenlandia corymbosa var. corymbosa TaxID=529605 RepID=A0AAV1DSR2_OLDCO|nr:OLC1v1010018C1 [Oldenlandia corymbosa var. corymbosa]
MIKVLLRLFSLLLPILAVLGSNTVYGTITSPATTTEAPPPRCKRTYLGENQKLAAVQYPFGFSRGCEIQLNLSDAGTIKVRDFEVLNVTSDNILVNLPASCNRSIEELRQLNGPNFYITWRNGLLLDNCRSPVNGCALPISLLKSHVGRKTCHGGGGANSMSCYSDALLNDTFLEVDDIEKTNCKVVFSSIAMGLDRSFQSLGNSQDGDGGNLTNSTTTSLLLNFQTLELGWWLDGECNCSEFATCTNFTVPTGGQGYRCKCNPGYVGDGFTGGDDSQGCRPIPHCKDRGHVFGRCGSRKVGVLIGGIMAGASLTVVLALFYYCIRKRSKLLRNRMSAKRLLSEAAGNSTIPFFSYKDIERATFGFSEKQRLGTGAYGTVYVGKLRDDESVAIKKIKHSDHESIEQVMNEIKLLSSIGKGRLDEIIDPFLEPHRDAWTLSSVHKVAELAFRCLAFHRDMRPTMMEVAEELEQIRLSSWAPLEENNYVASSVASTCSSPFGGSEKSFNSRSAKKSGIGSRRLAVSQRGGDRDPLSTMEESKDSSPVSVQDPWFSEQSSPSTNSLLNNVVQ